MARFSMRAHQERFSKQVHKDVLLAYMLRLEESGILDHEHDTALASKESTAWEMNQAIPDIRVANINESVALLSLDTSSEAETSEDDMSEIGAQEEESGELIQSVTGNDTPDDETSDDSLWEDDTSEAKRSSVRSKRRATVEELSEEETSEDEESENFNGLLQESSEGKVGQFETMPLSFPADQRTKDSGDTIPPQSKASGEYDWNVRSEYGWSLYAVISKPRENIESVGNRRYLRRLGVSDVLADAMSIYGALHIYRGNYTFRNGIPSYSGQTMIDRRLVSPEALEQGKEQYQATNDYVIVFRALSEQAAAHRYMMMTKTIRERSEMSLPDWLEHLRSQCSLPSGSAVIIYSYWVQRKSPILLPPKYL
ncbi:uncharacterized protein PAC_00071 [Phialocephala subalpina]|uniref:DUF8035 domain-containing protein n=1 Tax=Phialocephala subalpina TaxID=576137 RepID=A0A1L7WC11_9HELO|nr:uncharacterized protein PAC_00071 [Phialocephala subalpina]